MLNPSQKRIRKKDKEKYRNCVPKDNIID